jgi:multisubunit Na+/H+ antiporter MnhB subunit
MNAGVAAVICDVVLTMGRGVLRLKARALHRGPGGGVLRGLVREVSVVLINLLLRPDRAADTL